MKLLYVLNMFCWCLTVVAMQQESQSKLFSIFSAKGAENKSKKLSGEEFPVYNLTANVIAFGEVIQIINTTTGEPVTTLKGLSDANPIVQFHPFGVHIAIGDKKGKLILCDVYSPEITFSQDFKQPIIDFSFNRYGNYLAIAFNDGIKILDMRNKMIVDEYISENKTITRIDFSPTNDCIAIVEGKSISIWQPQLLASKL